MGAQVTLEIACFLLAQGETVVDVRGTLTERQRRRLRGDGKSDPRESSCRRYGPTRRRAT